LEGRGLSNIQGVRFSPDGQYLAATGTGGMQLWTIHLATSDASAQFEPVSLPAARGEHGFLAFAPNSRYVAEARSGGVRLWDVHDRKSITVPLNLHKRWGGIAFHPDNHLLGLTTADLIEAWNCDTAQVDYKLAGLGTYKGTHIEVSPDGKHLATNAPSNALLLFDLAHPEYLFEVGQESPAIWDLDWSPDGHRVALGLSDGGVVMWDLGAVRKQLEELGLGW
jgi:WD40 repeat protein